ncbi:MAG: restriction endonuclease subunit S [candidate division KSB1 bacterium]|nr:restriction endonuclease subunit S [candidate division KSB1 bacterium]
MNSSHNRKNKLKDYCHITSSKRIYASDYVDNGIPFIRGREIVQRFAHDGELRSNLYISREKFELIKNKYGAPEKGDILITSVGTLGIPYIVTSDDEFYFKDGNLIWFKNIEKLNSTFFYYWLLSPIGRSQLHKCTIGTSQSAYTIERLKEIEIDDLSLTKQEKIASILSSYDDLIENNRRRIQLLERSARLLYREWFVHLRFPGHEHAKIVDGVPEGWENNHLGDVAPLNYGKSLKKSNREIGPFPVYGSSGIIGYHSCSLISGPAIIIGRKGNVGKIFWSYDDCYPIDTVYYIENKNCSYYLYYALKNITFISTDVAVPGLNRDFAHSRSVIIPDDKILRLFENYASDIHRQIYLLIKEIDTLSKVRDLLLPKLMNGEITICKQPKPNSSIS